MRKRMELPGPLGAAPFTIADARSLGVPRSRLKQSDISHVSRGLYRPAEWNFELEDAARALSAVPGGLDLARHGRQTSMPALASVALGL
jgi:hypothetical protein